MTIATVFLVAALVVFILAAIPVPVPQVNLVALGLALMTASFLMSRIN
jgi:hypothetical protein